MLAVPMTLSTSSSSNMACTLASASNPPSAISSRPKLSLQTACLPRTFGSSSTGLSLSLAAGPTASPTVRNTFNNAYDPTSATSSPSKPSATGRLAISSYNNVAHNNNNNTNPYQLPLGVKSILRNSPLEPTCRSRSISIPSSATGARRAFFPPKKQVSYRQPLEEEIRTVHYTARHSDLAEDPQQQQPQQQQQQQPQRPAPHTASDEAESDSTASGATSDASTSSSSDDDTNSSLARSSRKKRKHLSAERQVRAVALMDGIEGDGSATPQTPRQHRAKRRCEWRWTLGPLETTEKIVEPFPAQDSDELTLTTPPAATTTTTPTSTTLPILSTLKTQSTPHTRDNVSPLSWDSDVQSLSATSQLTSTPSSSVPSELDLEYKMPLLSDAEPVLKPADQ
ncbi:hypothetical protein P168DRAFT_283368 [Aspergillus campestris IBT 28561]|uniref:Uncharacterized protein n=1 Tax=Aspergillus campestris (strain IBT 28561) TaxID=1392248 RepID=A0A2I1CYB3_ASPC2|nr:uncharacterized protein P168DRAFT_283368 [Aspergillus campestris IBT 28561]PKY02604.1 hypothetical protein P168DRAFT_283368 [Aspergillus campestris IBT 28561]